MDFNTYIWQFGSNPEFSSSTDFPKHGFSLDSTEKKIVNICLLVNNRITWFAGSSQRNRRTTRLVVRFCFMLHCWSALRYFEAPTPQAPKNKTTFKRVRWPASRSLVLNIHLLHEKSVTPNYNFLISDTQIDKVEMSHPQPHGPNNVPYGGKGPGQRFCLVYLVSNLSV